MIKSSVISVQVSAEAVFSSQLSQEIHGVFKA